MKQLETSDQKFILNLISLYKEIGIDMENMDETKQQDFLKNMFKNPSKIMDIVKNIGGKLEEIDFGIVVILGDCNKILRAISVRYDSLE